MRYIYMLLAWLLLMPATAAAEAEIRLVTDQAEAALGIIELTAGSRQPTENDLQPHWQRLWNSEGYQRLLERETTMGRQAGFQEALASWLTSAEAHAQLDSFRAMVAAWKRFDGNAAGARAAVYLPAGTRLRATLYPVIKHTSNTFVFDLENNPSIFMTLNPADDDATVEATITHELHHIGMGQCPDPADMPRLDSRQRQVLAWLGVLGEGFAVLATAGSPYRHPHYFGPVENYLVWERDIARFSSDLPRMESFFTGLLNGNIPEGMQRQELFTFITTETVPQGPAYTVGWKMVAMIERAYGRDALVNAMCDPRRVLALYNAAAGSVNVRNEKLPLWSENFLDRLQPSTAGKSAEGKFTLPDQLED